MDQIKRVLEIKTQSLFPYGEEVFDDISVAIKYSKSICDFVEQASENFLVINKVFCEQIKILDNKAQNLANVASALCNADFVFFVE